MPAPVPTDTRQEAVYDGDYDYARFSPHLKHATLNAYVRARLRRSWDRVRAAGLHGRVLEVGAGDGRFTEPLLAWGAHVTATEMSGPSCELLREAFAENERLDVVHDPEGTLAVVGAPPHDLVVFAAVLHHVPDYVTAIEQSLVHLRPGGSLLTFQDPLLYRSLPPFTRWFAEGAFVVWRLGQGNLRRGMATRLRKILGRQGVEHPSDTVEFHVVRAGVDQEAVRACLAARFDQVTLTGYWSAQSAIVQRIGTALRLENTFSFSAEGFRGT
jgi:SAM-dependent methyltransferase